MNHKEEIKTLLVGSANPDKAKELQELLTGLDWDVKSLADFPEVEAPEETEATFEGNALLKARFYSERFGVACVADDSGLQVDALDGAPGVYSARYAGEEGNAEKNNVKLMEALEEHPWHERTARFTCCAVFLEPGKDPHIETGTVEGHMAVEPCGDNGFGYDPLFVPDGFACTFAELENDQKHRISHRGRALHKLRVYLEQQA